MDQRYRTCGVQILAVLLALAARAAADPLPNPPPLVLPDPSPQASHNFPPATATAGTADPGHQLASINDPDGCSQLSPCAVPPPALHGLRPYTD